MDEAKNTRLEDTQLTALLQDPTQNLTQNVTTVELYLLLYPKNASLPAPAAGTRALEPARLAGAGRRHAPARTSSLARRRGWHKS